MRNGIWLTVGTIVPPGDPGARSASAGQKGADGAHRLLGRREGSRGWPILDSTFGPCLSEAAS